MGREEKVAVEAAARGIDTEIRRFPEGTRTAEDAAAAIGCDVAQIVKSLVFLVDDEPVMALIGGADRLDERKLAQAAGTPTHVFASRPGALVAAAGAEIVTLRQSG